MKLKLISAICIMLLALSSCAQPDLESDSPIEKALVSSWQTSDGAFRFAFSSDFSATWNLNGYTYEESYRVSDREVVCDDGSPRTDPVFRVNSMTRDTLSITGIHRIAEKYGTLQLTRL